MLFMVIHDVYVTGDIRKGAPAGFDVISVLAFSQGMEIVNKHYGQVRRWYLQSGDYKLFDTYCGTCLYLLCTITVFKSVATKSFLSLAVPKLPDSVNRSPLDTKKESIKECTLCALRKEEEYKSDNWEAMETKVTIAEYKHGRTEEALNVLKNARMEEEETVFVKDGSQGNTLQGRPLQENGEVVSDSVLLDSDINQVVTR
jgi:hypothetical protein